MSATPRRVFTVLVLLAWVHLVFAVYPTPAQKEHEIAKLAEDGVAADESLRSQGVPEKLLPQTTKEQYVTALTSEYWRDWSLATAFLLLGIVACRLMYRGHWFWPWMVGVTSALYAAVIAYPILKYSVGAERSFGWIAPIARGALSGDLLPAYFLFVQPLFHLAIAITCLLVWRWQHTELSRAKVA